MIDRWIEPLLAKPAARAVIDLKKQLEGTAQMETKPDFVMATYIRCSQDALWDALSDPANIVHWHFMATRARRQYGGRRFVSPTTAPMATPS